jgi:hypothetical protein
MSDMTPKRAIHKILELEAENKLLRERLMVGGNDPTLQECRAYSNTLYREGVARFGDLTRLEMMLQLVVGYLGWTESAQDQR